MIKKTQTFVLLHFIQNVFFFFFTKRNFLGEQAKLLLHPCSDVSAAPFATQPSESEHVSGARCRSAHNAYRSDLNSVTTDNLASSWGSIRGWLEYATCHFCIREPAVQSGTFSLVFVIILQAKLLSSRGLKCQMIYSSPRCLLLSSAPPLLPHSGGVRGWDLLKVVSKPEDAVNKGGIDIVFVFKLKSCAHRSQPEPLPPPPPPRSVVLLVGGFASSPPCCCSETETNRLKDVKHELVLGQN